VNDLLDVAAGTPDAPLAELLRPRSLSEVVGQDALLAPTGALGAMLAAGRLRSMVLWGPPGTGKTSMARLLADACGMRRRDLHASTANVAELKAALAEAAMHRASGRRTCLLVDEIHRMPRPLQDQLLGPIESGLVVLVACTTEHVAYELVDALLSRIDVLRLAPHDRPALEGLMARMEAHAGRTLPLTPEARSALIDAANGDGRRLLGFLEAVSTSRTTTPLTAEAAGAMLGVPIWRSDRDRDLHYDRASAMQKAVRASDPDAALYWFAQMLEAGEDMDFVMRRLLILANEEVGLADPQALVHCVAACDAYARLGSKAGAHVLAQAIVHLATSPKSDAVHRSLDTARALVRRSGDRDPNAISVNHPTAAIAQARGYVDDHTTTDGFSGQDHWPQGLRRRTLYEPTPRGVEAAIARRVDHWSGRRCS
jgi:putative ATPase